MILFSLCHPTTAQNINFADLFTAKSDAYIKTVSVSVNNGGSGNTSTITVPGKEGTYTVTVTDDFYCNASTATITVNKPGNVTKWSAKTGLDYEIDAGATKTLTLNDIFTANGNLIKDADVSVTGASSFTKGATWDKGTVTFNGEGTYTVTITDGYFCTATEATVTITEVVPVTAPSCIDEGSEFVAWITETSGLSSAPTANSTYIRVKQGTSARNFTFKIGAPENATYALQIKAKDSNSSYTAYGSGFKLTHNSGTVKTVPRATKLACRQDIWGTLVEFDLARGDHEITFTSYDEASYWDIYAIQIVKVGESTTPLPGVDDTTTPIPTPEATWESLGWDGSCGDDALRNDWVMTHDPCDEITLEPGDVVVYNTVEAAPYTGIYGMQLHIKSGVTTVKATTSTGCYGEFNITGTGWTSGFAQDQPMYFEEGVVTIYLENTGDHTVVINGFDFASLNKDGSKGAKYEPIVKIGGEIPTIPDPTPTPTPGGMTESAPSGQYKTSYSFNLNKNYVVDVENASLYSDIISFVANKSGTATVIVEINESGYYNINAIITNGNGGNVIKDDLIVTTENGESTTYSKNTNGYNLMPSTGTVYLARGDRRLTFTVTTSPNEVVCIRGVKPVKQ